MPIVTVTAAISGLKSAVDLAKAAIAARDELKLAEMQQAINDRVIDVQNAALALQEKQSAARDEIDVLKDELRTLKTKIDALETTASQREMYVLRSILPGKFAYILRGTDTGSTVNGEPEHWICQPCFDGPGNRKVVLRERPAQVQGRVRIGATWSCPVCHTSMNE